MKTIFVRYYFILFFPFLKNSSFRLAYNPVHSRCFCGLHSSVKEFEQKLLCLASGKVVFLVHWVNKRKF